MQQGARANLPRDDADEKAPDGTHIEVASEMATLPAGERSQAEKKLVRKTDLVVCLVFGLSYFFAYLVSDSVIRGHHMDMKLSDN